MRSVLKQIVHTKRQQSECMFSVMVTAGGPINNSLFSNVFRYAAPHSAGGRDQPFCLVLAAAVTQNALQRLPANARTLPLSLCAENPVRPFAHSADSRVLMCKLGSGTPPTLRYVCRFHRRILYRGLSAACHPDQDKVGRVCTKHQSIPSVHIVGHARRRAWPSYRGKACKSGLGESMGSASAVAEPALSSTSATSVARSRCTAELCAPTRCSSSSSSERALERSSIPESAEAACSRADSSRANSPSIQASFVESTAGRVSAAPLPLGHRNPAAGRMQATTSDNEMRDSPYAHAMFKGLLKECQ